MFHRTVFQFQAEFGQNVKHLPLKNIRICGTKHCTHLYVHIPWPSQEWFQRLSWLHLDLPYPETPANTHTWNCHGNSTNWRKSLPLHLRAEAPEHRPIPGLWCESEPLQSVNWDWCTKCRVCFLTNSLYPSDVSHFSSYLTLHGGRGREEQVSWKGGGDLHPLSRCQFSHIKFHASITRTVLSCIVSSPGTPSLASDRSFLQDLHKTAALYSYRSIDGAYQHVGMAFADLGNIYRWVSMSLIAHYVRARGFAGSWSLAC